MINERKKILVVDDEPGFIEILRGRFETRYELFDAQDGEAGIRAAIQEKPDLILLDIVMPKMSGYETLKKLKAHTDTRDIPVVMLTSVTETSAIDQARELGMADYLIKPLHLEELPAVLLRYA